MSEEQARERDWSKHDYERIHSRDDIDEAIRDAIVAYFNSLKNTSAAIGNEVSSESDWLKPGVDMSNEERAKRSAAIKLCEVNAFILKAVEGLQTSDPSPKDEALLAIIKMGQNISGVLAHQEHNISNIATKICGWDRIVELANEGSKEELDAAIDDLFKVQASRSHVYLRAAVYDTMCFLYETFQHLFPGHFNAKITKYEEGLRELALAEIEMRETGGPQAQFGGGTSERSDGEKTESEGATSDSEVVESDEVSVRSDTTKKNEKTTEVKAAPTKEPRLFWGQPENLAKEVRSFLRNNDIFKPVVPDESPFVPPPPTQTSSSTKHGDGRDDSISSGNATLLDSQLKEYEEDNSDVDEEALGSHMSPHLRYKKPLETAVPTLSKETARTTTTPDLADDQESDSSDSGDSPNTTVAGQTVESGNDESLSNSGTYPNTGTATEVEDEDVLLGSDYIEHVATETKNLIDPPLSKDFFVPVTVITEISNIQRQHESKFYGSYTPIQEKAFNKVWRLLDIARKQSHDKGKVLSDQFFIELFKTTGNSLVKANIAQQKTRKLKAAADLAAKSSADAKANGEAGAAAQLESADPGGKKVNILFGFRQKDPSYSDYVWTQDEATLRREWSWLDHVYISIKETGVFLNIRSESQQNLDEGSMESLTKHPLSMYFEEYIDYVTQLRLDERYSGFLRYSAIELARGLSVMKLLIRREIGLITEKFQLDSLAETMGAPSYVHLREKKTLDDVVKDAEGAFKRLDYGTDFVDAVQPRIRLLERLIKSDYILSDKSLMRFIIYERLPIWKHLHKYAHPSLVDERSPDSGPIAKAAVAAFDFAAKKGVDSTLRGHINATHLQAFKDLVLVINKKEDVGADIWTLKPNFVSDSLYSGRMLSDTITAASTNVRGYHPAETVAGSSPR